MRAIRPTRRELTQQYLDWTERTHHLAGPPGMQFLRRLCDTGWMLRARDSRTVLVMPKGWQELHQRLGVDEATVRNEAEHRHAQGRRSLPGKGKHFGQVSKQRIA